MAVHHKQCGIPAKTLPPCDLEWGHDGDMHGNMGDGFYAAEYLNEHRNNQDVRRNLERVLPDTAMSTDVPIAQPASAQYKLTRIRPLTENIQVSGEGQAFLGVEFEPSPNKKYIFSVEVGDHSPKDAQDILNKAQRALKGFVPEGSLIIPCRNGHPVIGVYEIEKIQ